MATTALIYQQFAPLSPRAYSVFTTTRTHHNAYSVSMPPHRMLRATLALAAVTPFSSPSSRPRLRNPDVPPDVLWYTNPTLPEETAVVVFTGNERAKTVALCRGEVPPVRGLCSAGRVQPHVLASGNNSVLFVLPADFPIAVYGVQLCGKAAGGKQSLNSSRCSSWVAINDAEPWWAQGDRGRSVTSGTNGWIRIFGRALAFERQRCLEAETAGPAVTNTSIRLVPLPPPKALANGMATAFVLSTNARGSCYDLQTPVPESVPPGRYTVEVLNGIPGSSWVAAADGIPLDVLPPPTPPPTPKPTVVVQGRSGKSVAAALAAVGAAGGGTVALQTGATYAMDPDDTLYIPDGVTLTTETTSMTHSRAMLLWLHAAPSSRAGGRHPCRGPGQQWAYWKGNVPARIAECPPLIWGNGTFTIAGVHARAPALSSLLELVQPSMGAVVRDCTLEIVGAEVTGLSGEAQPTMSRRNVNVSNVLHVGNCSGFTIMDNQILHVADGALLPGGQYGGVDTPAPCGANSPDNYAFFFDQGAEDGAVLRNNVTMGCNGWGTQSHARLVFEGNNIRSVGVSGVEGSGFSSASTVPRANRAAFLRNRVRGTNAATGPHKTHWCHPWPGNTWCNATGWGPKAHPGNPLETLTSDGSYGGFFGGASMAAGGDSNHIVLAGDIRQNTERGGPGHTGIGPPQQVSPVDSWRYAAMVVVDGPGTGQVRTVVGQVRGGNVKRDVLLDRPLTTALGEGSIVTIAPDVGRWIVVGNTFSNGTSVQTYGITLHAIFADNSLHNMTKSAQVDPSGICLTSGGYGTGTMPNMYVEIAGNRQYLSGGVHLRCGQVNGTALTYGFAVRANSFLQPPPLEYFGTARWPDSAVGLESGGQITVGPTCTAGLIERNVLQDVRGNISDSVKVDGNARTVVQRDNHVTFP